MLKTISPSQLGFNLKVQNGLLDLSIPQIEIDFQNGQSNVAILDSVISPLTVSSLESLLVKSIVINANVNLSGTIITFGSDVSGSGDIFGSGIIQ